MIAKEPEPERLPASPCAGYRERVFHILTLLEDFYEPQEGLRWLTSEQPLLKGKRPSELLLTAEGTIEVMAMIETLRSGAYV